ncbi:methylmalonyl-CoA mutase family protein [Streptomyces sp. TRM75563]|uniref:methylmalonyl-CoA mutase family protein n=1 Tax=Streptomyces sp. TRM75563 TaxID=2817418 RepID=UPI001F61F5DA|nr:methylmalonyl-CoA mutase family protein [Streptomyces sp. TRM75563]MCI4039785.1 methylmalonyl-CoA mutase family protein [Streptomyces sp. TRM75563]
MSKPGEFPYEGGIHPKGYVSRPWTIRQLAGLGDGMDTNRRFHYLLDRGETGLSLAFDLPTQLGLDPDDPAAAGEVGRAGVSVATVDDLAAVFDGIPLDKVSVSFTINATAPMILALWTVVAEESGVDPALLRGTLQNEMLKEHAARKAFVFELDDSFRFSLDVIEHCVRHLPKVNPVSISGGHAREAGATRAMEVALGIADAEAYLQGMLARGFTVDEVAPRLSFIFGTHMEVLAEAAKFRVLRRMYARRMVDLFGATNDKSTRMRIQVNTFGSALAASEPLNNIARTTVQAMAAVLGGVQSLHVCGFDEAAQTPGQLSARVALRVQQILLEETDLARHIDPLGGSEAIARIADELEAEAKGWLDAIAARGGLLSCLRSGWLESHIEDMAYNGTGPMVGVVDAEESEEEDWITERQLRSGVVPGRRRPFERKACTAELRALTEDVSAGRNVMDSMIEAARSRASIGQMQQAVARGLAGQPSHA